MVFSLEDLERKPIDFREEFSAGQVDFGPELKQLAPLLSRGRATLI